MSLSVVFGLLFLVETSVAAGAGDVDTPAVVLVILDGLRADQVTAERMPFLAQLRREGLSARRAVTPLSPSRTIPAFAAFAAGGSRQNRPVSERNVYDTLHRAGLRLGCFAAKGKLRPFLPEAAFDRYVMPQSWAFWAAPKDQVFAAALDYAARGMPDFLLVHIAEIDTAGHTAGWLSEPQRQAQSAVDAAFEHFVLEILSQAPDRRWIFLVTSDHGGHDGDHEGTVEDDRLIPWTVWKSGLPQGHVIDREVFLLDTMPTVFRLLGVPIPEWMEGAVVEEVL